MVTWVTHRATVLVFAFLVALPLYSQAQAKKPANSPAYDVQSEAKIKGTVEELKVVEDGKAKIAKLVFNNGTETVSIFLCPQAFLEELGVSFAKGDNLEITGSKTKIGDAEEVLARQIQHGDDTVVLRDKKGNPVWN